MKPFLPLLFVFFALATRAQTLTLGYDNAGNRTTVSTTQAPVAPTTRTMQQNKGKVTATTTVNTEVAAAVALQVYPNPATEVLYVNLPTTATLQLYNSEGKLLYHQTHATGTASIDVSTLPAATYLLQIRLNLDKNNSLNLDFEDCKISVIKQ